MEASSALIVGEVNPLDLCALTAVRRFCPSLYEIIWNNASFFSNSRNSWKTLSFQSDEAREAEAARIREIVKSTPKAVRDEVLVKALLTEMFPARVEEMFEHRRSGEGSLDPAERQKRIAHPDYFPIYFHCEVPETVFSAREMESLMTALSAGETELRRRQIFNDAFDTFEKDSIRRYEFIHKICVRIETMPIEIARSVSLAISECADRLGDEMLVSELRRALGGIFAVAQRLSSSDEVNRFIGDCIMSASSDLFAVNIYKLSTTHRGENSTLLRFEDVGEAIIREAFISRMSSRYGGEMGFTPTKYDMHALYVWSRLGPAEHQKVRAFWQRFIGQSRRRLAEAFDLIVPAGQIWNNEALAFIDELIPIGDLGRMYEQNQGQETLDAVQERALARLERVLRRDVSSGEVLY